MKHFFDTFICAEMAIKEYPLLKKGINKINKESLTYPCSRYGEWVIENHSNGDKTIYYEMDDAIYLFGLYRLVNGRYEEEDEELGIGVFDCDNGYIDYGIIPNDENSGEIFNIAERFYEMREENQLKDISDIGCEKYHQMKENF